MRPGTTFVMIFLLLMLGAAAAVLLFQLGQI
jgi:hypothetical protein